MSYKPCKLGDVLALKYGKALPERHREPGEIPVYGSGGHVGFHKSALVKGPGIIVGRKGSIGTAYYESRDFFPIDTVYYVEPVEDKLDLRFAYYLISYLPLNTLNSDAAVPGLNRETALAYDIVVPQLPVQQKTAAILSAYDDLIDNNRKRIALLEKAARLLYEEWFVRLQFPGHEHTPVVDGVPEGWKMASVKNICYVVKDAVHPNQIEGGAAYIGLEHMPRKSITLQDWGQPEDVSSLKYRYLKGDILFGKIRPYFHKVGFTLNSGICSTDAIVLRPTQEKYYSLLLMFVSSEDFVNEATQSSNGTKMPRANWRHLEKLDVLIAPDLLLKTFSDYIKPILLQLENAAVQTQKLQQARDLLLPRLMSGELAV